MTRFPRGYAQMVANAIKHHFDPFFERIEIAGSIRRRKKTVKDIELVGIPKMREEQPAQVDLFGNVTQPAVLVPRVDEAIAAYNAIDLQSLELAQEADGTVRDGERMKKLIERPTGIPVDLFLTTAKRWGYIFVLRTGPTDWNLKFSRRCKQVGLRLENGDVYRGNVPVSVTSEEQMFKLAKVKWTRPEDRE